MSDTNVEASEQVAIPSETVNNEVSEPTVTEEAKTEETKTEEVPVAATNDDTKEEPKSTFVRKANILKTTAREDEKNRRGNNKFDPSVVAVTDDPKEIRKQVEFYFGDANLPIDEFLWKRTEGEKNTPVLLKDIHKFKRMQRFQPYSAVVAALKESSFLNITGDEDNELVSRKQPYDPASAKVDKTLTRSIYAKGFGDEEPSTQFDIEAFFAPYGPVNAVRLRRTPQKLFKGSVFVEFADDELAQKFLALDPAPKWKGEHELEIMLKKVYTEGKTAAIAAGEISPNEQRSFRGRGRGGFRGDRDPDDWKKRRDDDQRSGFKGGRGGRGGRGRGGRGRGRGGNDRGPRNDRNRERDDAGENGQGQKRAREDDGAAEQAPAKKVDTKEAPSAETS